MDRQLFFLIRLTGQFYGRRILIYLRESINQIKHFSEEDMECFKVKQLKSLFYIDLTHLVKESKEEGFRFLERLVNDYENGTSNVCP